LNQQDVSPLVYKVIDSPTQGPGAPSGGEAM